jgi:general secretion pathway protein K
MTRAPNTPWPYGYVSDAELRGRYSRFHVSRNSDVERARPALGNVNTRIPSPRQRGVALVVVITSIAILAVFVAELIENTTTDFHVATAQRDRLKAEYLARSGVNLTRLLIAREKQIRQVVGMLLQPLYQGAQVPQLNVWDFADMLLAPFSDPQNAEAMTATTGIDFGMMEGLHDTGGTFEVVAVPENSKINVSAPLFLTGDDARRSTALQLFELLGGRQSPDSPFDPMFSARDPDGQYTTRLDLVSAMIDWWDYDEERTLFDPGNGTIAVGGSEDDVYGTFPDPYLVKNAPFDSLEEIRLIRGVGDDFWATFVESESEDPRERKITIYASGAVNANFAPPQVLHARLCSLLTESPQPLCTEFAHAAAFIGMLGTMRAAVQNIPLFSTPNDFLEFVSGSGRVYTMLTALMTAFGQPPTMLAWTPLQIPPDVRQRIAGAFLTEASIYTIESTAYVGRARAKMSMVVNFDPPWTPPRGVPGSLPALGVAHHYRLE